MSDALPREEEDRLFAQEMTESRARFASAQAMHWQRGRAEARAHAHALRQQAQILVQSSRALASAWRRARFSRRPDNE